MPGQASLRETQYYAHPRNAFWPIMCELLSEPKKRIDSKAPYVDRIGLLQRKKIALWDVLARCYRPGSLDSNIDESSIEVNDFAGFLSSHSSVNAIFFNGGKAEQTFQRHVLIDSESHPITYHRLPSSSPAHASMSFEQKLDAWRGILGYL